MALERYSILIFDSKKDLAEKFAFSMTSDIHPIFTASCPAKAFEIISNEKIDFVISELAVKRAQGLELLQRSKILPKFPYFIFYSSEQFNQHLYEFLYRGVLALFHAPYRIKSLYRFINYYIENEINSPYHPRRKHIRIHIPQLNGMSDHKSQFQVNIENIALGGMCLNLPQKRVVKPKELLNFTLDAHGKEVNLQALCRWERENSTGGSILGMEFIDLKPCNQEALALMINNHLTKYI
jgi:DNA-binding response OmpR family regulator